MSDTCFDSSLIMVFLICWLISFPMPSTATKRQMPPAVCKPTPMAERIRFFFMLFMFLSVLFVRVEVLAVILGLVIILDGKLGAAVQAAQAHGTVLTT